MTVSKEHFVGHLIGPNGKPQNVEFIAKPRPNITKSEASAGIGWVDARYEPGYIERYGGLADGTTDSTTAFNTAVSVGRQNVKFYETGRVGTLSTYTSPHNFYKLQKAYVAGNSVIGPANFTSDGAQDGTDPDCILQLGRNPDFLNGVQYKQREIKDIIFSGKVRADNGVYMLGNTGDITTTSGPQYTAGWRFTGCFWERCNKSIIKPEGNFANYFIDCSGSSGHFGMWAEGRSATSIATCGQDYWRGGEWSGFKKAVFYYDDKQQAGAALEWHNVITEDNNGFCYFLKDLNSAFEGHTIQNCHFERNGAGLTVDADGIAASQTPGGAGNFTLNGALTSGGTYTASSLGTRQLSFTSGSDESGDSYTVTGTLYDDSADTEVVVGPNATTVNGAKAWKTISQIATSGAATGAITIGVTENVDLEDGGGPRAPREIYCENVDGLRVINCWTHQVELIDSTVIFDGCKFVDGPFPDGTKFYNNDVATIGYVTAQNVSLDGWGDNSSVIDSGGAHVVTVESVTRQNRILGAANAHIMGPIRTPIKGRPANATVFESDTNEQGDAWLTDDGGSNVAGTVVAGHSYPTATSYTFTTAAEWISPATMAIPENTSGTGCTEDNWLVTTLEVKIDVGDTVTEFNLQIGGAGDVTRVSGMTIPEGRAGEWVTITAIGQVPSIGAGDGSCRYHIKTGGATATIAFGAFQVAEFSNAQGAMDFYNSLLFYEATQETTKVRKTDSATRASTTTVADDTQLKSWNLEADTWYKVRGMVILDTDATAYFKYLFDFSSAAQTIAISCTDQTVSTNNVFPQRSTSAIAVTGISGSTQFLVYEGSFLTHATTGGDVSYQWAQNTSNAYATKIDAGSWLTIERLFNAN